MREKYGRPGISGRKRARSTSDDTGDSPVAKVARFKVKYMTEFYFDVLWYLLTLS